MKPEVRWSAGAARPGGLRCASLPRCHPFAKARPWPGTERSCSFSSSVSLITCSCGANRTGFTASRKLRRAAVCVCVCVRARCTKCLRRRRAGGLPVPACPPSRNLLPSFSSEGPPSRRQAYQDPRRHCAAARGLRRAAHSRPWKQSFVLIAAGDAVCVKAGRCRCRRQSSPRPGAAVNACHRRGDDCQRLSQCVTMCYCRGLWLSSPRAATAIAADRDRDWSECRVLGGPSRPREPALARQAA